jgi:protein SCO1/2
MFTKRLTAIIVALALVCLSVAGGCGRPSAPASRTPEKAKAAGRTTLSYRLVGEVREVDPGARSVTIRHEAIPDFMPAMTMKFTLKDRAAFDDLRKGDEVEGNLRVDKENGETVDYELTDLVVARPATPPALTLRLNSDGQAELATAPKVLEPGDPVPDFSMTTQDGATVKLSDLRGKVVVLTFIYTRCPLPEFCPAMDRKFSELAGKIGAVPDRAAGVRLVSLSFDPEHDTPAVLREHAKMRGSLPPLWTFAVASHEELAKVARPLGLSYGPGEKEIIHNLSTAVIGPDGRLVRLEAGAGGKGWEPADLLKTIYSRIARAKG